MRKLLKNGSVIDGSGAPALEKYVTIDGEHITAAGYLSAADKAVLKK